MIGCMADAASKGGYHSYARVLCLEGVGAGGIERSDLGPGVVICYEGTICIDIVDRSYGVSS